MPKKPEEYKDESIDLLTKILVLQLFGMGATQSKIAKTVGKSKSWVNDLLKGIPKGGKNDGTKKKG